jgi:hypothetical protein
LSGQNTGFKNGNPQTPCDNCWDENTKPWRAFFYRLLAKKLPQPLPADATPEALMAAAAAFVQQAGGESAMMSDAGMVALVQEAMEMAAAEQGAPMAAEAVQHTAIAPATMEHGTIAPLALEHAGMAPAVMEHDKMVSMAAETQQTLAPASAMGMAQYAPDAQAPLTPMVSPSSPTPVPPQELMAMAQQLTQIALATSQSPSRPASTASSVAAAQPVMTVPAEQAVLTAQPAPAMGMEHSNFGMAPCNTPVLEPAAMADHSATATAPGSVRPLPLPMTMVPTHAPMAASMAPEQPTTIRLVTDLPPASVANGSTPSPLTPKDTESPIDIISPPLLWQPMLRQPRRPHAHAAQIRSLHPAPSTPPPPPPIHS